MRFSSVNARCWVTSERMRRRLPTICGGDAASSALAFEQQQVWPRLRPISTASSTKQHGSACGSGSAHLLLLGGELGHMSRHDALAAVLDGPDDVARQRHLPGGRHQLHHLLPAGRVGLQQLGQQAQHAGALELRLHLRARAGGQASRQRAGEPVLQHNWHGIALNGAALIWRGSPGLPAAHLALNRALQVFQQLVGADGEFLHQLLVGLQGWLAVAGVREA
jgi:hypothetical protein